jgi:hypothetical protein
MQAARIYLRPDILVLSNSAKLVRVRIEGWSSAALGLRGATRAARCGVLLFISACSAAQWTKADATNEDLKADAFQCRQAAQRDSSYPVSNSFDIETQKRLFERCMEGKGWSRVQ